MPLSEGAAAQIFEGYQLTSIDGTSIQWLADPERSRASAIEALNDGRIASRDESVTDGMMDPSLSR
jgi:hypothetical protein